MRVIFIIGLVFQLSFSAGQENLVRTLSLPAALKTAPPANNLTAHDTQKLSCEIKSTWYTLLYRIHKYDILREYLSALADLNSIALLRYEAGDAGLYETSVLLGKLSDVETSTAISANEIEISRNDLGRLLNTPDHLVPADSGISIYEIDKGSVFMDTAPPINMISDSLEMENRILELDNLFIRLQQFQSYGLAHAEVSERTARARFRSEEIDYVEFIDKLAEVYAIRLEYLHILNTYNQHAIQLEYDVY
jgi:outer membrane protein TolC